MTSLTLSYVPVNTDSIHVYLNGVEQYEPDDWTFDAVGNKIDATSAMDARSDDLLEARYAHRGLIAPDPWAAWVDRPTNVHIEYFTSLGRDFFSAWFETVHHKTPADGWAWQMEVGYVDGTGTLIYDGRAYPMRNMTYNSANGRWEIFGQQNPSIHPSINRAVIQASGSSGNTGVPYPEWQYTDTPVTVGL